MAYTITTDISRMLLAGQKKIFFDNLDSYPKEYDAFTTDESATKQTETYDTLGNLKAAQEKVEGGNITYGKVTQAYQTSITNKTWANGFEVTVEATKYDLYGCVNSIKAKELARTMLELEEANAIYWIDNIATVNLADGVPLASNSHPLVDSASTNDTLAAAGSIADPDNHMGMINMFYDFKNHAGGPMIARPKKALTHYVNQFTVEEVYGSTLKANEMSNTKNVLPKLAWNYSTYMSSRTAYMMWDDKFTHIIMQWFARTMFDADTDKVYTKNMYFNAMSMYNSGCLPSIGIVYNPGA